MCAQTPNFMDFLDKKGAEYAAFDPTRAPKILEQLALNLPFLKAPKAKIISIIGTNGKGSSGRFLAQILRNAKKNESSQNINFIESKIDSIKNTANTEHIPQIAHFTSPHILELNERFWLNGELLSDGKLQNAFEILWQNGKNAEVLGICSYFEFLTFLALIAFKEADFLILEAGLGGEFDSTITCTKPVLSLFCPIDFDHCEILGKKIEQIAATKLRAMAPLALLAEQKHKQIKKIAKKIAAQKSAKLEILNPNKFSQKEKEEIAKYSQKYGISGFLKNNLELAFLGAKMLNLAPNLEKTAPLDLNARAQKIAPNIYIDVAHNPHAARALRDFLLNCKTKNLVKQILKNKKIIKQKHKKLATKAIKIDKNYQKNLENKFILIYNSFFDKNFKGVLRALKPITKRVEVICVNNFRILKREKLNKILKKLQISYSDFKGIKTLQKSEKYLVCGSFSVVAEFLREFKQNNF